MSTYLFKEVMFFGRQKVTITQQGDNKWQANYEYYDVTGKRVRKCKKANNKNELLKKLKEQFRMLCADRETPECSADTLFRRFVLYWIENVKKKEVKPSYLEILLRTYNNHIEPELGNRILGSITRSDLQQVIYHTAEKGLSASTVKKVISFFYLIFKYACIERIIPDNPAVELNFPKKIVYHNTIKKPDDFFTIGKKVFSSEEIEKFKRTAEIRLPNGGYLYKYGYIFLFMLNTGLRVGEVLALKWKDVVISEDKNYVCVYKTVAYGTENIEEQLYVNSKGQIVCSQKPKFYVQNEPKTFSSKRIVPLLPEAKEYLLKYKEQFYKSEDTFIIHSNNGNGLEPLTQSSFQHRFCVFKKAANVNTSASLHALRHTFATRLYRENIPLKYISAALGHSSTKITSDAYVNIYNMENYDNAFKNIYGINGL